MNRFMIKVDVISGFLGAGKTTLIKKLFEKNFKDEKVVLIENEFGEIGIDGSFLKESGVKIKEINSGCICCSLVGDFETSLKEVISTYHPDRIIIEPSGVGKLSDIVNAIMKIQDVSLSLNILTTVVDGVKAKLYMKNFGEFFNNQVEAANTIIVAKTDKMPEEKIVEVVHLIRNKNQHANIITTSISDLDSEKLLKTLEEKVSLKEELLKEMLEIHHHEEEEEHECCHHHHHEEEEEHECCHHHHHEEKEEQECCHHHHHEEEEEHECCHHHHHDADEVFTSWGIETPLSFSKEQLTKFLEELKQDETLGMILRSKGILKASDQPKWYYFDYVSGDYEIRDGEADVIGRIVVIGSKLNEEKIQELFEKRG